MFHLVYGALDYVKRMDVHKGYVNIIVDKAARHLQEILTRVGTVDSIELRTPTLNDVFLNYTGREIRDESPENRMLIANKARRKS